MARGAKDSPGQRGVELRVRPRRAVSAAPAARRADAAPAVTGSMNGRTCTREQGHAAKSHRYS